MSQNAERIKAVIFDLDDTLIDWSQPSLSWDEYTKPMANNLYDHLAAGGHTLPERSDFFKVMRGAIMDVWEQAKEDWTGASFVKALKRTLQSCDVDPESVDLQELMRAYDWRPMPGVELFDDAHRVLEELRARRYKLGLITNSFLPMWMRDVELRHYDLIDYFHARLTSGDAGYMKPHPAIYRHMLDLLETEAQRAVFVGDRPQNDIAGANTVGLISVLVDPPHLDRDLEGHVPDYTITTLSELIPVLEQLEQNGES